eukprot:TRINITY_DN75460_c0_g1_i1.p1 TRINITY_DN75460_c0_g1~~TRINITY_DN75460_c0_g1_i1.p1  ORF type:complete len:238 (-),score=37.03 TRINITY_DN75460_c0_g1_i1:29-670(-)
MQPRGLNAVNDMSVIRDSVIKETEYLAERSINPPEWPPRSQDDFLPHNSYLVPKRGDRVTLFGVRKRRELNGCPGQIVSEADPEGFVTVRVFTNASEAGKLKQVHMDKLKPTIDSLRSPAQSLRAGGVAEGDAASTFSRKSGASLRAGSIAEGEGASTFSRKTGSVADVERASAFSRRSGVTEASRASKACSRKLGSAISASALAALGGMDAG